MARNVMGLQAAATLAIYLSFCFIQSASGDGFCWKPNHNPFTGVPEVIRVDDTTVKVTWQNIFPSGAGCQDVDFLIKSHPVDSPSNYKLSDFTLRGQRSATMTVPAGSDFIFQVISREDKGPGVGIEYAYSRPVTSLSNPTQEQTSALRRSIWVAGANPRNVNDRDMAQHQQQRPLVATPTTTTTIRPTTSTRVMMPGPQGMYGANNSGYRSISQDYRSSHTTAYNNINNNSRNRGGVSQQSSSSSSYAKPNLKSLHSNSIDYYSNEDESDSMDSNPWYIYECVPPLKNMAGFETGSKKNSILKKFIRHMNSNTVNTVEKFLKSEKECRNEEGNPNKAPGHLVDGDGTTLCCSTPWGDNSPQSVCYHQFVKCDGRCIPQDWVADGWPDCMDGADEANMSVDGNVFPYQLGCVHCAGVILSAGFLCRESSTGLTRTCVEGIMGPGQCNVCITEYMNLP